MATKMDLKGVICAAVTPLKKGKPDSDNLQRHLRRLAAEGCDGVLLLGTTGEGPSMGMAERGEIVEAAVAAKTGMKILVGTGTPSLPDTIHLTRRAFELGADAVVALPPYYFKKASDAGVIDYFKQVFDEAVPDDKLLLLYHIPQVSGMPVTFGVLEGVMKYAGDRMAGIKDSGGDIDHARELCQKFPELRVFVGTDSLLLDGLCAGAAGCITAAANVIAPLAVKTYRAFIAGEDA
ncbi:MAG: dihydrodipicolinate synthase family protein, partial [Anaerolineae bacterium]|nr:dihydrodipicolinate synthase family protein [Anaerolineae bacterium]